MAENKSATRAVLKKLIETLKTSMPELESVYDDFPNATQTLKYPSLSIFTNSPKFTNLMPYVIKKTAVDPDEEDPIKFYVVKVIGQYEFNLQLDLWTKNKYERHDLYEKLFRALNPDLTQAGLRLKLEEYYDLYCSFTFMDFQFMGGEAESQRNEYRVKLNLMADVKAVQEGIENTIVTIENNLELPSTEIEAEESADEVVSII